MVFTCCVPGCNTTGKKIFHSFPKDKTRCQRWIHSTKCFYLNHETAYKTQHKVCRLHFQPGDYTSTLQKYLKVEAIPSVQLPELDIAKKYLCSKNASNNSSQSLGLPCTHKCLNSSQMKEIVAVAAPLQEFPFENLKTVTDVAGQSSELPCIQKYLNLTQMKVNVTDPLQQNVFEKFVTQLNPLNDVSMDHAFENRKHAHAEYLKTVTDVAGQSSELPCIQKYLNLTQMKVNVTDPLQQNVFEKFVTQLNPLNDVSMDHAFENRKHTHAECPTNSNIEQTEYPMPYLSDDIDDNEIFENIDLGTADNVKIADVNTSTKNIYDLSDTLVPEPKNVSNSEKKPNVRSSSTYDPAARRARYQATRIKFLTQKLRNSEKLRSSQVLKHLERILDENQMTFVNMQIKNACKKPRGRRFSFEEKCMAFAIYKQSPKCYRFLSSLVTLPCKQTLMKHSASIRFEAGINPKLMSFLKDVVKDMDGLDKHVTIGWDEMALNAHLDFCKVKDYIDGFVDDGTKTTDEFATHALVFMVRGINKSFKQPICYFLTQNINKDELAELIKLVIEAVLDTGLKIMGSVCDAVSTNLSAVKKLVQPQVSRLPTFGLKILEYRIRDTSIIHYFDPPHLIKSIRNNMLTKDLYHFVATKKGSSCKKTDKIVWDHQNKAERVASWDDVTEFEREYNQKGINQLLRKITDEHIEPKKKKMKVSTAVQVFSRTFGKTMRYCSEKKQLAWDFTGTADILLFFNEVFDSLNGGGLPSIKDSLFGSVHHQSYHFTFWKYAVEMLKKMRFVPKDPDVQEKSRVLNDYILTINGLTELVKRLLDLNVKSVSIRMMTQDALENFFGGIRAYCYAAVCPTPRNFKSSYTTSLFNNLSSRHSIKSNCEDDGGVPLIRDLFSKFSSQQLTSDTVLDTEMKDDSELDDVISSYLVRKLTTVETEAENYIAGHICKTVKNDCTNCEKSISSRAKNEKYHGLLAATSQCIDDNMLIIYPKPKLIDCLKKVASRFEQSIPFYCSQKLLSKKIIQDVGVVETFAGCDLHKTEFTQKFIEKTSDFLITGFINKVNNFLSGKIDVLNEPYNHIQKAAFDFRQKKKHIGKFVIRN